MKHIREFNDEKRIAELKNLCDNYLAYLIDQGFKVEVFPFMESTYDKIKFTYEGGEFSWDNLHRTNTPFIIDDFIPFLKMLKEKCYFEIIIVMDKQGNKHRIDVIDRNTTSYRKLDLRKLEYLYDGIIRKIEIIVKA